MKANAPKRKIFDAVDMMTADATKVETGNGLQSLPVDKLIPEFKKKLDDGSMTLVAAVDLSYLSEQEQGNVAKLYEKGEVKLDTKSAKAIRESAGDLAAKKIVGLLDGGEKKMPAAMSIKIPSEVYQRFFPDKSPKEAAGVVESDVKH